MVSIGMKTWVIALGIASSVALAEDPHAAGAAAAAAGHQPAAVITLKNDSLNDLFACNDLLNNIEKGYPGDEKIVLSNAGNLAPYWRGNKYTLHPELLTYFNGRRGFFLRNGAKTYFVPRPEGREGILIFPESKPLWIAASPVSDEYPKNNSEISPQHGWNDPQHADLPQLIPLELADTNPQGLAGLRARLNLKIADLGENLKNLITLPNRHRAKPLSWREPFVEQAEEALAHHGSAEKVLMKLDACRMAMAPDDQKIAGLIADLRKNKDIWNDNIKQSVEIQKAHREYYQKLQELRNGFRLPD